MAASPPVEAESVLKSPTTRRILIALAVVLALIYLGVLISYIVSGRSSDISFSPGTGSGANYVDARTSVLTVDPSRRSMSVRLNLAPHGSYAGSSGNPTGDLMLRINNSSGADEYRFAAGGRMLPVDATLDMDGDITTYPFDRYVVPLDVEMWEANASGSVAGKPVPIRLSGGSRLHSYQVSSALDPTSTDGDVTLQMGVRRSARTVAFAVMIIAAMIMVTGVLVAMATFITVQQRRVEYPMFAFMGGSLFAITAVRNAMPDTPPAGTLSDYLVFFWALGIIAVCLVVGIIGWIRRPIPYS
jgi:hypothetical protein